MPRGPTPRRSSSWAMERAGVDSRECASRHGGLTLSGRGSTGGSGLEEGVLSYSWLSERDWGLKVTAVAADSEGLSPCRSLPGMISTCSVWCPGPAGCARGDGSQERGWRESLFFATCQAGGLDRASQLKCG